MSNTNVVVVEGRLGKDPEMSYSPSGVAVTKFSLAVDKWNTSTKQNDTMWLNIVCFNKTAEIVAQHFTKGKPASIVGELSIKPYTRKDGTKSDWVEIIASQVNFVVNEPKNRDGRFGPPSAPYTTPDAPGDEKEF